MLAAVLTVSGPWLPARWRHWWWTLLLAFVPIHLVVSAIVPARSLLGLAVGWFVGALVVLVVGTPALEVPLDGAVRAMAKRGFVGHRGSGWSGRPDPGRWSCRPHADDPDPTRPSIELYGPHQRSGGALRQLWRKLRLRGAETAPLRTSMRRAVEHRALMAIAIGDVGPGQHLDDRRRHPGPGMDAVRAQARSRRLRSTSARPTTPVAPTCGNRCESSTTIRSPTATCAANEITVDDGTVLFGGFGSAEYGATDTQLQSDIAQLLVTTSALYDAEVRGAARRSTCSARTPS